MIINGERLSMKFEIQFEKQFESGVKVKFVLDEKFVLALGTLILSWTW